MGAETSPVKAPSLLQETFWTAMATRELFAASKAVEIAVNGGATTMSQCSAFETSGRNEEKNARVSASVLYIFQLPAITRRRICASGKKEKDNAETPRPGRGKRRMQRLRREEGDSFVGEGFDAGEFASAEEFEGGAAAGGDMRNFVGNAGLMDGGYGITATDNGSGAAAGGRGDGFGYLESAFGERGHFEYAHGTIPNDGFGGGNFLAIGVDGFRADIETHTAVGRGGNGNRFRGGVGFEFGANDVVDGKEQSEFSHLRFFTQTLGEIQLVVLDEGLADRLAFGFEKRVSHAATDEHGVGDFHESFDDFDFVADFGAAENGDERACGIRYRFAEISQLFFHEQASGGLLDEARDADNGGVCAVRGAECIADKNAIAESGELLGKRFVVFFFFRMEADVFQDENFTVAQGFALAFGAGTDTIERKRDGTAEKLFQLFRARPHGIFEIRAAFGAAEMRSEHKAGTFLNGEANCGQRFADARVVGDDAGFERNVEVHTDEDALAAKIEIVDGELGHGVVARD